MIDTPGLRRPADRARAAAGRYAPAVRLLAGAGILVALVGQLGAGPLVAALQAIDGAVVLAALGIGLLSTVVSAWRWCLVARGLGLRLSLGPAVAACYRAVFLNSVLPAGVLGDVHRAVSHGRQAGDVGRGVRAVALERSAGMVVAIAVGVAVLLAQPSLLVAALGGLVPGRGVLAGLLAVVVAGACALRMPRVRAALHTGLADVRTVLARWPGVVLLSVAAVASHLALFVMAARAAGSQAPLSELLPLLVLALLAAGLPINIGGWGPREVVSTAVFGAAGFGVTQGLTVAVVYGVLSLVACLPGAVVLMRSAVVMPGGLPLAVSVAKC